jgi:hypothetical protein
MSREAVTEIVAKARTDEAFRQALLTDPSSALGAYATRLSEDEREALTTARSDPFALAALLAGAQAQDPWWRSFMPSSFRDVGGALLSAVLVVAFLVALLVALNRIGTDPRGVSVGGNNQTIDEFSRAKDVLLVVVPLFGAVLTFWLGVAVEGRRADDHKQNAAHAGQERDDAKERERKKTTVAASALAEIGQAVKQLRTEPDELGARGLPGEEPERMQRFDELDEMIEQARRRIES